LSFFSKVISGDYYLSIEKKIYLSCPDGLRLFLSNFEIMSNFRRDKAFHIRFKQEDL